jgi:hypothetical protein
MIYSIHTVCKKEDVSSSGSNLLLCLLINGYTTDNGSYHDISLLTFENVKHETFTGTVCTCKMYKEVEKKIIKYYCSVVLTEA